MPAANAQIFIGDTLESLTVDDVGQGPILIYPFNRELFRTPFFRVPDSRHFFVFALLRNAERHHAREASDTTPASERHHAREASDTTPAKRATARPRSGRQHKA